MSNAGAQGKVTAVPAALHPAEKFRRRKIRRNSATVRRVVIQKNSQEPAFAGNRRALPVQTAHCVKGNHHG